MVAPHGEKFTQLPSVAGVKRCAPAPSLLPAFEPLSSSPTLPRPLKRRSGVSVANSVDNIQKYPTPLPSSSTAVLSSPPRRFPATRRPNLQRTVSTLSERAPLSIVPSIELDGNGKPTLMGRSSTASDYQLSSHKLVSRVHVRAAYTPAASSACAKIEVECMGWNKMKVHCQGRAWELDKGDTFTSETEVEIMVDVQDARVLLRWPSERRRDPVSVESDLAWDEDRPDCPALQCQSPRASPVGHRQSVHSPLSPTPAGQTTYPSSSPLAALGQLKADVVHVFEDGLSDGEGFCHARPLTQSTQFTSQPEIALEASQSSILAELQEFSDRDEENDPIVHSFGPFGDNILPRLASFTAGDTQMVPDDHLSFTESLVSPQRGRHSQSKCENNEDRIANHVTNQLAFSRLASTPLSTIMYSLPAELRGLNAECKENKGTELGELRKILEATKCIGEVIREGKDAAGKPLESEYYYIPDADVDDMRKGAVVDGLRKPGLRACRKQHKQYYWRKPKRL